MLRAVRTLLIQEVPAAPWSIHVLHVRVGYVVPAAVAGILRRVPVLFVDCAALADLAVVDRLGHGDLVVLWAHGALVVRVVHAADVALVFLGVVGAAALVD